MMWKPQVCAAGILFCVGAVVVGSALPVQLTERWPLPGDGGWDYPTADGYAHLLYLSRATHVAVVDTRTGSLVGDIEGTPGVHGIAIAADLGRGYISAGKADQVKVFDLGTRAVTASIPVGTKPDAILYDQGTHRVVAFNGHSDNASVIDAVSNKVIATIPLGGGPEFGRSDGRGHVFVNLEDKNQLVAIDLNSLKVTAHWPLPGCDGPTGLAFDVAHHRSFSVCSNAQMTILDTETGRVVANLPTGHGTDGADFDPASLNAFSANGDGTLTVVHETDPEHFSVIQNLPTAQGARTIAFDSATHRVYLPTASFAPPTAAQIESHEKPPVLPDSFVVLVVATQTVTQ